MIFSATEQQILQIAANATNASFPMGMGLMHFRNTTFKPEDFQILDGKVRLDYVQGRMVKLSIWKNTDGTWEIPEGVRIDYQSWLAEYPTIEALVRSVVPE